ncbi:MAG: potassium channel family protein [Myxococcota bacterium]
MSFFDTVTELSSRKYDEPGVVRLLRASGLLITVFVVGTFGYWSISDGGHSLIDAAYMTVITLTTVGYGEVIPISGNHGAEIFTIGLLFFGMGVMLYFLSSLTAFIIEGELREIVRRSKMKRELSELEDHIIIAGIGQTGTYVLREMLESGRPCVVIEQDEERIHRELEKHETRFPYIAGDATDDDVLEEAGLERALGLVCSLGNDRDNLFVTISARSLSEDLRIVTRGEHPDAEQKFKMAGATSVIYTKVLGGLRMAAEAIRPEVTTFLDLMMQDHGHYRRVEELAIPDQSPLIGSHLRDARIREISDALVIAVHEGEGQNYTFNPGPDYTFTQGSKLIVLTLIEDIPLLEHILETGEVPERKNW